MTFKELCEARYSCRAYKQEIAPKDKLNYVLECARLAPSACNKQPWRLRVLSSDSELEAIRSCYNRDWFKTAPQVIVVSVMKDEAWVRQFDGKCHSDIDASIIAEHICLAATEQGLGTCWVCNFDPEKCHEAMDMNDNEVPVVLIPVGIPADKASVKKRKPLDDILVVKTSN